jgi:hypothetical protein
MWVETTVKIETLSARSVIQLLYIEATKLRLWPIKIGAATIDRQNPHGTQPSRWPTAVEAGDTVP